MNKAFKKYGKVRFSSIIPRRLRIKRALRTVRAAQILSSGAMALQQIREYSESIGCKVKKAMALINTVVNATESVVKAQRS